MNQALKHKHLHYGFTISQLAVHQSENSTESGWEGLSFQCADETHFRFSYLKNSRFGEDKLFEESEQYIFGIDGVILNKSDLLKSNSNKSWKALFLKLYRSYGSQFVNELNGEFSGFIFDKTTEHLFFFTNQTGSKKVYYYRNSELLFIAPSLQQVSKFLVSRNIKITLNYNAAYHFLSYGGMPANQSLMNDVFRLSAGEYLEADKRRYKIGKYLDYNEIQIQIRDESKIISGLEERFQIALRLEYDKESPKKTPFLATLSGGLDSRMNVFLAAKKGYSIQNLCFSQSGYDDEKIARKISKHLKQNFIFVPLDGGKYVFDFKENMNIYEGQIFYSSSAHFNYAVKQIDISPFNLIHTGLLGDGILGTHISKPITTTPNLRSKLMSDQLFQKVESFVQGLSKEYVSEDVYNLQHRFSNIIISGAWAMEQHAYLVSPFMQPDFMQFCLTIPPSLKYERKIYLKWINKFHPDFTKFRWEATGMRPRYHWQISMSRYPKKLKSIWYQCTNQGNRLNMTPYDFWYQKSDDIRNFIELEFHKGIELLNKNAEFKKDVTNLFINGNMLEKTLSITLLAGIELLNVTI